MTFFTIGICLLCLVLSGYFSASETAFLSFNRIRMKTLADDSKRAKLVLKLNDHSDKVISTILVGNNIVNILMTSLSTMLFLEWMPVNGATVSTVVVTVVVLIFGEISPKSISQQHADGFILATAPILNAIIVLLTPITVVFRGIQKLIQKLFRKKKEDGISEDELKTFVDEAEEDGGITKQEGDLIRSAIEFNDLDVQDILTPRVSIVAFEENDPREEISKKFTETGFSRLPVYSDTIDNILGIVHEKDFFTLGDRPIASILSPALCIPPHMKISDLLRKLQQAKTHIAVVVDEFGGTEGIVTLEDVLEELVGEIWDEHDTVIEPFRQIDDTTYRVACDTDLKDLFEKFEIDEEDYDAVTVGGWVMQEIGKLPAPGDSFTFRNLTVAVLSTENRRVTEIEVSVGPKPEPED